MDRPITIHPIGIVHSPYMEAKGTPIQGVFADKAVAWVELKEKYVEGLKDLDGFSHAILLYHFHLSDREDIVGKPYLEKENMGFSPSEFRTAQSHWVFHCEDREDREQQAVLH